MPIHDWTRVEAGDFHDFLSETRYIAAPLETTYMQAWAVFPALLKNLIESPAG